MSSQTWALAAAEALDPREEPDETWPAPADTAEELSNRLWKRAPHLELLSLKIRECAERPDGRLMVHMPPRHGKTELTSTWTPPWYLRRWRGRRRVILASYAMELARENARKVRNRARGRRLGVPLAEDSQAAGRWHTAAGGGLQAVGVGGSITGFGGDLIIIDDPVKDRASAESKVLRDAAWEWYTDTLYTRLEPGGSLVVVATRWHVDDLPGRILEHAKSTGEEWEVVNLPAIAGPADPLGRAEGEALWPDRYPLERLEVIRATEGPYGWASLYQQEPVPRDGGAYWSPESITAAQARAPRAPGGELTPDFRRKIVAVDPNTEGEADEAGVIVLGLDRTERVGVLEDRSGRVPPDEWGRRAVQAYHEHGCDAIVYEKNQGGKMVMSVIREAARGLSLPTPPLRSVWASHGKSARAEPVSVAYANGRVWHAHPFPDLSRELTSWVPHSSDSPNRLDALVWGVAELLRLFKRGSTLQRA